MTNARVLIIFPWLPSPPMGGADLRNMQTIHALAHCSEKIAVMGVLVPDKDYERPLIENLEHWDSPFGFKKDENKPSKEKIIAAARNMATDYCYTQESIARLNALLDDFKPHIALLSQLAGYPFFDILKKHGCKIIFDCHNIEGLLISDVADSASTDAEKKMYEILIQKTRMIEAKLCNRSDQIWVCSDKDKESIQRIYRPPQPVVVVPNTIDTSIYSGINTDAIDPAILNAATVIFPAYFAYTPNTNAARRLIHDFFPVWAKRIPGLKLLLAGRDPSPDMCDAAKSDPDIIVTHSVPDILPWLAASKVMVGPIFEGSGTRLKILQAFGARVPVVTTGKGAEGLACTHGRELLFAETGEEFCERIEQLLHDRIFRDQIVTRGYDFVRKNYSRESLFPLVSRSLDSLTGNCQG